MKIRHEYLILFFGILISSTIKLAEPPIITVFQRDGQYYEIGTGRIVNNIDPNQLTESGTMYVDFPGTSYSMYSTYTIAGRIAYWTLMGSIILSVAMTFFSKMIKKCNLIKS